MIQLTRLRSILQSVSTRSLIFGASASAIATTIYNLTIAVHITKISGSAIDIGLVFFIATVPLALLSPIAGVICDRFNKKTVILVSDWSRALIGIILFLLLPQLSMSAQISALYLVVFIFSVIEVFYTTSYYSIIPSLVAREKLLDTNIVLSALMRISPIVSPVLAVFIYSEFGLSYAVLMVAIMFALAGRLERKIVLDQELKSSSVSLVSALKSDLKEFSALMKSDARITSLNINGFATHLFLFPFLQVGLPFLIIEVLKGSPVDYGTVEMIAAIGTLLSIASVPMCKKYGTSTNLMIGMAGMAFGSIIFLFLLNTEYRSILTLQSDYRIAFFGAVCFFIYWFFGFYGVFFTNFLHENIARERLGKGMAIQFTLIGIGRCIGFILFGYLFSVSLVAPIILLVIGMLSKFIIHVPFIRATAKSRA